MLSNMRALGCTIKSVGAQPQGLPAAVPALMALLVYAGLGPGAVLILRGPLRPTRCHRY